MENFQFNTHKLFIRTVFKVTTKKVFHSFLAFIFTLAILKQPDHISLILALLMVFIGTLAFLQYKCLKQQNFFFNSWMNVFRKKIKKWQLRADLVLSSAVNFKMLDCEINDQNTCAICLQLITKGNHAAFLKCNHVFHQDCLEKWLLIKKNCPLCKSMT